MKHRVAIALTLSAIAAALSVAAPASATDRDAAVALCRANPGCKSQPAAGGRVHLFVGNNYVSCPPYGECQCLYCGLPIPDRKPNTLRPNTTTDVGTLLR